MQEQRHPLGELIREQMSRNEWSLETVVKRATQRGEKLGRSNLDAVIKNPPKQLSKATLFGIAAGIGVTPQTVAFAALASMGVNPSRTEITDAEAAIRVDPSLSVRDKNLLVSIVGVLREQDQDNVDLPATDPPASTEDTQDEARAREKIAERLNRLPSVPDARDDYLALYGFTPSILRKYNIGTGDVLSNFLRTVHEDAVQGHDPERWIDIIRGGFADHYRSHGPAKNIAGGGTAFIRRSLANAGWVAKTWLHTPKPTPEAEEEADLLAQSRDLVFNRTSANEFLRRSEEAEETLIEYGVQRKLDRELGRNEDSEKGTA